MNSSSFARGMATLVFGCAYFHVGALAQDSQTERFWHNPLNNALAATNNTFPTADQHARIEKYYALRTFLMETDRGRGFGAELALSKEERVVDGLLNRLVSQEMNADVQAGVLAMPGAVATTNSFSFQDPWSGASIPVRWTSISNRMKSSDVYQFLRRMPKGAALHLHADSAGRAKFIVETAAALTNCYVYFPEACEPPASPTNKFTLGQLNLIVDNSAPEPGFVQAGLLFKKRPEYKDQLLGLLTVTAKDAMQGAITGHRWDKFGACFPRIWGLVKKREVYPQYIADAFTTMVNDHVDFVELRCELPPVDNPKGTTDEEKLQDGFAIFRQIRDTVRTNTGKTNFNFKVILDSNRVLSLEQTYSQMTNAIRIRDQYNPANDNIIAGFDVVGAEDGGKPEADYLGLWLRLDDEQRKRAPLYLHAGESAWANDVNLYDAILFGTRRLGHGFNLFRFPALMEYVKAEAIALEICPISNMLLGVCVDPRVHPAYTYLQRGIPCVLSSDDPAFFGYHGLSPDFWVATVAWGLDLRALKKLSLNSLLYSSMTGEEKDAAVRVFHDQWGKFIKGINDAIGRDGKWACEPLDEL